MGPEIKRYPPPTPDEKNSNLSRIGTIGEEILRSWAKSPRYALHVSFDSGMENEITFNNGYSIGIIGLESEERNKAASLAIGVAAHLIREPVAKKLAKKFNCSQDLTDILKLL